jgi:hypothetical protein
MKCGCICIVNHIFNDMKLDVQIPAEWYTISDIGGAVIPNHPHTTISKH